MTFQHRSWVHTSRAASRGVCIGLSLVALAAICQISLAQPFDENEAEPQMATRIFSVADLVLPAPDYSFQGINISVGTAGREGFGPPAGGNPPSQMQGGMGGMGGGLGGGGFGGGGMGGGGGFFQIGGGGLGGGGGLPQQQTAPAPTSRRFGMGDLIDVVVTTIQPTSWDVVGGEGSIVSLGTMLVVRQTPAVLEQVDELLMGIRQTGGTLRSVTIRADWLLLEPGQLADLYVEEDGQRVVSRDAVRQLATASGASGQITCFDGQTVHLVAGRLQTGVSSVIPVVGQLSPEPRLPELPVHVLAQQFPSGESANHPSSSHTARQQFSGGGMPGGGVSVMTGSGRSVGYQPVMQATNLGALLQVTPTVGQGFNGVVLDLRSMVARPASEPGQPVDFQVVPLDRLNVIVQQFMTTLHLPLDQPQVIAGSTLQPFVQGDQAQQLYLVVEVSLEGPR